ncbi:nitrilase-related carbon-nitrogen hydrolase [Streptosporangium sp. KLBMP 9127]|nr:hypothetical protein [Streptosporangium sp. KLBMP 9127]
MSVIVGAVQLVSAHGDVPANLDAIEELAAAAAADGAAVIVTPEMALTGYLWPDDESVRRLAEPVEGPSVGRLTRLCRLTGAWLLLGLPELDEDVGTLHNTCVLIGPDGPIASYRKTQLFVADPLWAVDGHLAPPVWDTPAGRIAPLICADLDHPEPMRHAALRGADWVAMPAAWVDEPGPSATWRLRAWENGLPVVAADQAGAERIGARVVRFSGGSCVLDHEGTVLAALDDGPGHLTAALDHTAASAARRVRLAARRPAEYGPLTRATVWPRPDRDALTGRSAGESAAVTVAVLAGPPAPLPAPPEGTELAVLPAFHLTGGLPAADRADEALRRLRAWCAEHRCDAVTSLAVPHAPGTARYAVTLMTPAGEEARRHVTHLGRHAAWAVPGTEPAGPVARPWGLLGLLTGEELEPFEPSRSLAVLGADVIAVPADVAWPYPVAFAGTRVPLEPEALRRPDPVFAHPARLRAGDSHVWIALANDGPVPSGVFAPDHIAVPRVEALTGGPGWAVLRCRLRGGDGMGAVCAAKPQLARRRTDLFGISMVRRSPA